MIHTKLSSSHLNNDDDDDTDRHQFRQIKKHDFFFHVNFLFLLLNDIKYYKNYKITVCACMCACV